MMISISRIRLILVGVLAFGLAPIHAQEAAPGKDKIQLSPPLMELLRTEMRALLDGIQSLPAGIATADWENVAATSAQIGNSYILQKQLTPAQRKELGQSLPEHFKRLDAGFHLEAKKLEAAALAHDPQLSAFHYYRLIETCSVCHALYAPSRFPGFSHTKKESHTH
jgi:hypothetical protein